MGKKTINSVRMVKLFCPHCKNTEIIKGEDDIYHCISCGKNLGKNPLYSDDEDLYIKELYYFDDEQNDLEELYDGFMDEINLFIENKDISQLTFKEGFAFRDMLEGMQSQKPSYISEYEWEIRMEYLREYLNDLLNNKGEILEE